MKIKLLKSVVVLLGLLVAFSSGATTSVWQITKGNNSLFIGGSLHILPPQAFPLPSAFEHSYKAADKIVFEADLALVQSAAFQQRLQAQMTLPNNQTLDQLITKEALFALKQYADNNGQPMNNFLRLKPAIISLSITMAELRKLGINGEGVDAYFDKRARADGKSLGFLESAEFQLAMLLSLGEGEESELLLMTLDQTEDYREMFHNTLKGWRQGDPKLIEEWVLQPVKEQSPAQYERFFDTRNKNWLPQIEAMLADQPIEFVVVGVGHLFGDNSVIDLLKKRGYQVKQLQ